MLIDEMIEMKWNNKNIDWYQSKGYIFTKRNDVFMVHTKDLSLKSNKEVTVKCDRCGEIIRKSFYNHDNNTNIDYCKPCANYIKTRNQLLDYEYIKEEINKQGYILLSENYIKAKGSISVQCPKGHLFETNWDRFRQGYRCPYCSGRKGININYIRDYLQKENYKLLSTKYINAKIKLLVECPEGHQYYVNWDKLKNGHRCVECNIPKNEAIIKEILLKNNINFQQQFTFDECKDKLPLPFDFAIFDSNNNLMLLIEYDGEFHYQPIRGSGRLKYQQKHDEIKNKYCFLHNIKLLRIPYWEKDNINNIILDYLNESKLVIL